MGQFGSHLFGQKVTTKNIVRVEVEGTADAVGLWGEARKKGLINTRQTVDVQSPMDHSCEGEKDDRQGRNFRDESTVDRRDRLV